MSEPVGQRSSARSRPATAAFLRPALIVIVGAAAAICGFELVLLRYPYPDLVWLLGLLSLTGVLYVLAGALAWDRRPSNRMGLWLVVIGFLILIARLSLVEDPWLATTGLVLAQTPIAGVVVLMLLFPSGHFQGLLDRWLAALAFAVVIGFAIPSSLLRPADGTAALRVADRPDVVAVLGRLQIVTWWLLLAFVVVLLVWRLGTQRAVRGERRARIAVYVTGLVSVLLLPLVAQLGQLLGWNELVVFVVQVALIAGVPVVFTVSLLAGGFGRTGRLDELATWLGSAESDRMGVRDALADTLGDQSLQLFFRRRGSGGLVDEQGRPVGDSETRTPAGAVEVPLGGGAAAVIVYDTAAVPDPQSAEAAGRIVAVALDRDRVAAELLAGSEELRRSRARLVEVGDAERRRLARDLHDGLQSRLVLAAIRAGGLAAEPDLPEPGRKSADDLRLELERSVDELRRLVHGVLPALLLERGLLPAARDLVERCGIPAQLRTPDDDPPLPPAVATGAYFVLAEAVTNAVKHADANRLLVVVETGETRGTLRLEVHDDGVGSTRTTGHGIRGMADRVEALGGEFTFHTRPAHGSAVLVTIPYDATLGALS